MSKFMFHGFRSMSEFVPRNPDGTPKRRGACGPLAVLLCLNVIDPTRWPLTPGALDALVNDMQAKGCLMRSDGESNIPGLDRYLHLIGIPHVTVGYDHFTLDGLHQHLKELASSDPRLVLVEWSAAGKGLHDDEANVAYHYSAFGGIDTAWGYYRGDGDSRTDDPSGKPTAPILTGWPDIEAAKPIGYLVIDVPASLKPKQTAIKPAPSAHIPPSAPVPAASVPAPIYKSVPPVKAQPAATGGTFVNIAEIFRLARAYQNLTPTQRAVLRLIEGLIFTAFVAALPIVALAFAHQPQNWGLVLQAAGGAAAAAVFSALSKYARAHADPALK